MKNIISQWQDIMLRVTSTRDASCFCVHPFALRNSRTRTPKYIIMDTTFANMIPSIMRPTETFATP